jgi:predicted phage tail protein
MYSNIAGGSVVAGGAGLAVTGFNTAWTVVAGVTLIVAGVAVMRLLPRRRRVRG